MPDYDAIILDAGRRDLTATNVISRQGNKEPLAGYARFVGRVGALAVFLGVGSAFATPVVAHADTTAANSSTGTSSTTDASSNADASPAAVTETAATESDSTTSTSPSATDSATSPSATELAADPNSGVVQASGGANTTVKLDEADSSAEIDSGRADPADSTESTDLVEKEDVTGETVDAQKDDSTDRSGPRPAIGKTTANAGGALSVSAATVSRADSSTRHDDITTATTTVVDESQAALVAEHPELRTESAAFAEASTQAIAAQPVSALADIMTAPVRFATGMVSALLGMNPLLSDSPVAPPASPTLWGLLAWVRRHVEYTFFNRPPTVNYDPALNSQSFNGVILGDLNAADTDGDKLTYTVTDGPEHGTVVVDSTGAFTYVPTDEMAAAGGTDTFTVTVDDRPGNPLHFHGLATFFAPNGGATDEAVVTVTVDPASAIGTEDQIRLEQLATQIANSPEVQAMRDTMREHWLAVASQKYAAIGGIDEESLSRLEEALDEFTLGVAMRVVNTDAARPEVLTIALPEHEWYGTSTAGGRWFYDNPDSVYRVIPVDADSSYVITGRYVGDRPLDGNLSVYTDNSVFAPVSNLALEDVEVAPDGTFTITVDATPANGRANHIQLMDGANQIVVRETLGDWTANAAYLEVTRVGGPEPGPAKTYDVLVDDAVALLVNDAVTMYRPELDPAIFQPANVLLPPITLPGTLIGQRQSWGHFNLAENEALVVTITPGDAGYFTIPVTDIWMKSPNYWDHQSSLNSDQAIANDDGTYTIVVSATDPGVANWVDTVGLDVGTLLVRWQLPGADPDGGDPTVSAQVVSLDDLGTVLPAETVWVTPVEREQQLDARKDAFDQRFSPFDQM